MPQVFRLEYADSRGVYYASPQECHEHVLGTATHQEDPIDHPRPQEDGMGQSAWSDMIFGFQSLEAMRAWFCGAERLFLSTHGVLLSCYFARGPICTGKKQLAFYRQSATLLWQKPLNHF